MPAAQDPEGFAPLLSVLCDQSELHEYGEIVQVGERVCREAGRREGEYSGGELDAVEWRFDQYAQAIGYDAATITGTVISIRAIFVNLERRTDGSWRPRVGTAHLEAVASTAETRIVEEEFVESWRSDPDENGLSVSTGAPARRDGDEHFSGWLFTLADIEIAPLSRLPVED